MDTETRIQTGSGLWKPLLLVLCAPVLVLFDRSSLVFDAISVVVSVVALVDIYSFIKWPERVRISNLYGLSILLAYGFANIIFLVGNRTATAASVQIFAPDGFHYDQRGLSIALALCLLTAAVLYYFSARFEQTALMPEHFLEIGDFQAYRLVWFGALLTVAAVASGAIKTNLATNTTTNVVGNGRESVLGAIVVTLLPGLIPLTLILFTQATTTLKKVSVLACLLLFFGVLLIFDRRYVIYVVLLSMVCLRMKRSWLKRNRFLSPMAIVGICIAIYLAFNFILATRVANIELEQSMGQPSTLRSVEGALSLELSGGLNSRLASEVIPTDENNVSRPFILSYFGGLADIGSPHLYGADFWYDLQLIVPSALDPGKLSSLPPAIESITHPAYGIPVFNGPHTDLISGYDDFGSPGVVLYPLAVVLLYLGVYAAVRKKTDRAYLQLLVLLIILFQMLAIERSLITVFSTVRNIFILVAMALVLVRIPSLSRGPARIHGLKDPAHSPLR